MPELPEVETVRRTLLNLIRNKQITEVKVLYSKIIKQPGEIEQFCDALKGQRVLDIERRGKFLIFILDHYSLVSHLRMEGRYGLYQEIDPYDKHTHVLFTFADGSQLRYRDVRKFGTMHLFTRGEEITSPPLSLLGPEPFSADFDEKYLQMVLKKSNRKIKSVLLDQKLVVGLGNIYVDEALFRAGIHPERLASSLKPKEIRLLHQEITNTLGEAIDKGGSTVRSYINSQGESGAFQFELFVYGRKDEECRKCGSTVNKKVVGGRGTHYCPSCQKLNNQNN